MSSTSRLLGVPLFGQATPRQREIGLTILRVIVGVIFIAHGGQKLFLIGLPAITGGFAQVGIPMASVAAPLVALVEFLGGIALLAGAFTRLAALGTSIVMLGAIFLVHLQNGFFLPNGFEFALVLLAASVSLILMGPGAFSVDGVLARRAEPAVPATAGAASRRRVA